MKQTNKTNPKISNLYVCVCWFVKQKNNIGYKLDEKIKKSIN